MFIILLLSSFPYLMCLCPSFVVVQSLSHVLLFVTQWTAACQASPSFTFSQSLLKLMSIESVMPSNYFILCQPLLFLPSIFPSIRSFLMSCLFASGIQSLGASTSASVLPMNIQDWFPKQYEKAKRYAHPYILYI